MDLFERWDEYQTGDKHVVVHDRPHYEYPNRPWIAQRAFDSEWVYFGTFEEAIAWVTS